MELFSIRIQRTFQLVSTGYIKMRAITNFTKVLGHKINLFYADIC